MSAFNGIDQNCLLESITTGQIIKLRFTLIDAYEDFTGTSRYIMDSRVVAGTGYLGTNAGNSTIFRSSTILKADGVTQSSLDSTIGAANVEIELTIPSAENDGTIKLFSRNNDVEYNKINTTQIDVYANDGTTLLHSFDLTNPTQAVVNDSVGSATLTLAGFTFATGPTITGPDSTTEGSATVAAGTDLDTVTTFSLVSGSYSIEQTIDIATATTLNYAAESGVNQSTPSTPVSGVPLEPTITAAGITPYVVQQEADDGTNPPATRNITLNPEATHEVIQTMIAAANSNNTQSIYGSSKFGAKDNMQSHCPKNISGSDIVWNEDGTITTTSNNTVSGTIQNFDPDTGLYKSYKLTIKKAN